MRATIDYVFPCRELFVRRLLLIRPTSVALSSDSCRTIMQQMSDE
ncbi:hypothetical protein HMPREF2141_04152 [Bacteroides uniformis]|nr:hypothetical protein HMPREF2141_04152 [Bacteroides uniformis]